MNVILLTLAVLGALGILWLIVRAVVNIGNDFMESGL